MQYNTIWSKHLLAWGGGTREMKAKRRGFFKSTCSFQKTYLFCFPCLQLFYSFCLGAEDRDHLQESHATKYLE